MFNQNYMQKYFYNYTNVPVIEVISSKETMVNEWYLDVGRNAVEVVLAALSASMLGDVFSVLDMPCGHGRVLRHLVNLFPDAQFTACDLDEDGVRFCAEAFGAEGLVSKPELCDVDFGRTFDVIWVGSLFTHTPEDQTQRWLAHLAKFLSPTGILVATFHGRRAIQMYDRSPFISQKSWSKILSQFEATGYGYADYTENEAHSYMDTPYGISLSSPAKIMQMAQAIPGVRIFQYAERAWADNQDVLVIGRPAALDG